MSESIRRKSSSRQLLQNLIRVTAQRSREDAEEVEREQRRRAREKQRGERSPSWPQPPQHSDAGLDEELKPSCCLVLEEDEGFSDWSHRLEHRNEQEAPDDGRARAQRPSTPQWKLDAEEEKQQQDEEEEEEEEGCEPEQSRQKMSVNRKEGRTSYSSTVFLSQDTRLPDRTSYLVAGTMRPRGGGACRAAGEVQQEEQKEEVQADLQREWTPAETPQSPRDEGDLSFTHKEKEDVHLRTEETHGEEEEEEEGHKMPDKRSVEGGRSQEVSRRSTVSLCSSSEGEEQLNCYGPMSPTFKKLLIQFYPEEVNSRVSTDGKCTILERAESLRKSTGSVKKTLPVAVSKIDKRLERYTHAVEGSSKEGRSGSQVLPDPTSPPEPVSSKKNLFEAWNQNAASAAPSKDADGLKVGVADLINQWVKGSEDGSRCSSPCKPAENSAGKRYKFVVTGHGKYEKVSVDDDCSEDANFQSAGQFYEDL